MQNIQPSIEEKAERPLWIETLKQYRQEWKEVSLEALEKAQEKLVNRRQASQFMGRAGFVAGRLSAERDFDLVDVIEQIIQEREQAAQ